MNETTEKHQNKIQSGYRSTFYKGQYLRLVLQVVLGISLLAGGIVLLALRIAGWSAIFGIPMVVISSVFIIYTYDDVLNRHLDLHDRRDFYDENITHKTHKERP